MNAPLIIDTKAGGKDRAVHVLKALDFGIYPPDGSTDEELAQAGWDMDVIAKAAAAASAAENDFAARREALGAVARLLDVPRYGVASGRFTADRRPLPIFAATLAARNGSAL